MKVVLWGWNGCKNVGDDAMTEVLINGLLQNFKIERICFAGCDVETESMPFIEEYSDKVKFSSCFIPRYLLKFSIFRQYYWLFIIPIKLIFNYDVIIIGGGSIFHSYKKNLIYNNLLNIKKLFHRSVKIVSIGTSVGPFYTLSAEKMFIKLASKLDLLSVRDKRSYNFCRSNNIIKNLRYAPDLAITLSEFKSIKLNKQNKVNIILRQGHISDELYGVIVQAIEHIQDVYPNLDIVFLSACELDSDTENDNIAISHFIESLPPERRKSLLIERYNSFPSFFYKSIGDALFNISVRLHGSIISYAMNTPFICISYHQKCLDFFKDMNIHPNYLFEQEKTEIAEIRNSIDKIITKSHVKFEKREVLNHFDELIKILMKNYDNYD
jgi:polysaccharide pyruvyl transferase WcaK-like protein